MLAIVRAANDSATPYIVVGDNPMQTEGAAWELPEIQSFLEGTGSEIQDLSRILHQSRTSLFNGCKEQFAMSPIQVIRSVRMHQVRHALLDVEFCEQNNLSGVIDVAQYFGFVGRSHFARFYKQEFCETPRQTLQSRRLAEKSF